MSMNYDDVNSNGAMFAQAKKIEKLIAGMENAVMHVEKLQMRTVYSASSAEEEALNSEFQSYCSEANKAANIVRAQLHAFRNEGGPGSSDRSLRTNQTSRLAQRFMDILTRYQQAQVQYSTSQKAKMKRQYKIANPTASERQIEEAISETNPGTVFTQQIVGGNRYMEAQRAAQDVERRHQEIVIMARNIDELQQMFLDLQSMIQAQNLLITNISEQIDDAAANTTRATEQMSQAVVSKRTAIRRKCMLIWCIVLFLLVLLVVLFIYFGLPVLKDSVSAEKSSSPPASNGNTNNKGN